MIWFFGNPPYQPWNYWRYQGRWLIDTMVAPSAILMSRTFYICIMVSLLWTHSTPSIVKALSFILLLSYSSTYILLCLPQWGCLLRLDYHFLILQFPWLWERLIQILPCSKFTLLTMILSWPKLSSLQDLNLQFYLYFQHVSLTAANSQLVYYALKATGLP
jgi:hypothetical protein